MKEDNLDPKNIKGDNSSQIIICAEQGLSFVIWLTVGFVFKRQLHWQLSVL